MPNASNENYMFDAAWQHEGERLATIERIWDTNTQRHLNALGVTDGWRCLEVGAGGGSVAKMLCSSVGPSGHVTATDLDTRFINLKDSNLTVLQHDILRDDLPQASFDLVHSRLLLEHLPERDLALDRMIAALKPGGRLLIEDFDHVTMLPDPNAKAEYLATWQCFLAAADVMGKVGLIDMIYGRRLYGLLKARGIINVGVEGTTIFGRGGDVGHAQIRMSIVSLRSQLIQSGVMDAANVDKLLEMLDDPDFSWNSQLMMSAWGTKP